MYAILDVISIATLRRYKIDNGLQADLISFTSHHDAIRAISPPLLAVCIPKKKHICQAASNIALNTLVNCWSYVEGSLLFPLRTVIHQQPIGEKVKGSISHFSSSQKETWI